MRLEAGPKSKRALIILVVSNPRELVSNALPDGDKKVAVSHLGIQGKPDAKAPLNCEPLGKGVGSKALNNRCRDYPQLLTRMTSVLCGLNSDGSVSPNILIQSDSVSWFTRKRDTELHIIQTLMTSQPKPSHSQEASPEH